MNSAETHKNAKKKFRFVQQPRWVLPMSNGAVDASGLSAPFIREVGTPAEFESGLRAAALSRRPEIVGVRPGEPITLAL